MHLHIRSSTPLQLFRFSGPGPLPFHFLWRSAPKSISHTSPQGHGTRYNKLRAVTAKPHPFTSLCRIKDHRTQGHSAKGSGARKQLRVETFTGLTHIFHDSVSVRFYTLSVHTHELSLATGRHCYQIEPRFRWIVREPCTIYLSSHRSAEKSTSQLFDNLTVTHYEIIKSCIQ